MLGCPNAYSYMYDPDEDNDPLMLYKIKAETIKEIFSRYPLEK